MNNKYFEFGVKPKNEAKELILMRLFFAIKVVFILIGIVLAYFGFMFFNVMWILCAISLTVAFVFHCFQHRYYNFYDFIFVDGNISLSIVINNKKRKYLAKFTCKNIENIGRLGGETYLKYINDKSIKKIYVTETLTQNDVCFLINSTDKKTLILFPFNEYFLVQVIKYSVSNVLDKNFISQTIKNGQILFTHMYGIVLHLVS